MSSGIPAIVDLAQSLDHVTDGWLVIDDDGRIVYLNPSAARIMHSTRSQLLGRCIWEHLPGLESLCEVLSRALAGKVGETEWYDWASGRWFEVRSFPAEQRVMVHFRDVGERTQRIEQRLQQALYDPLTNLPTRRLLIDRIHQALAHAERHGHLVVLLLVDPDDLTQVNAEFGHAAGDHLLVDVARRLQRMLRAEDTLARLSGDEFIALLPEVLIGEDVPAIARRITSLLSASYPIAAHDVSLTVSVGGLISLPHGRHPDDLLRDAERALALAKARGKQTYHVVTTVNQDGNSTRRADDVLRHERPAALSRVPAHEPHD